MSHLDIEQNLNDAVVPEVTESRDPEEPAKSHRIEVRAPEVEQLKNGLEEEPSVEGKLQRVIHFMEGTLAQNHPPHFRQFWQARELCLPLFKENIPTSTRSTLWNQYSELSKEARRLKELFDEQSAFAAEQIEIAIQALEKDVELVTTLDPSEDTSLNQQLAQSLEEHFSWYTKTQSELNKLNSYATRINTLRKELIKTEMRVRRKNQFFQQLSAIGDKIFPRRKELIQEVSTRFSQDIDKFIADYFSSSPPLKTPLYFLREEIKALQNTAKLLTLNTQAFNQIRVRLSDCWDKLKHWEKERRKEQAQYKSAQEEQVAAFKQKIDLLLENAKNDNTMPSEVLLKLSEINGSLRNSGLGHEEIKFIRETLREARRPFEERIEKEAENRRLEEQARVKNRQQKIEGLKSEIQQHIDKGAESSIEELSSCLNAIQESCNQLQPSKIEKQEIDRSLRMFRDFIADRKEQALTALPADKREALAQLQMLLQQRKERRTEIKERLDLLRKATASSGLGFEQAMEYQEQINEEKDCLEKSSQAIQEIEEKLSTFE